VDRLCEEIAHSVRCRDATLHDELVCLDAGDRSNFYQLLYRRDSPPFYAVDMLAGEREDVQDRPLLERKRILRRLIPRIDSLPLYVDHLATRGCDLFRAAWAFQPGHRRAVGPQDERVFMPNRGWLTAAME